MFETLETKLFFDDHAARGTSGCPIEPQGAEQIDFHPYGGPDGADKTGKAQCPLRHVLDEPQEQVGEQSNPNLPLNRLFVVADKISELEGLLEFLEERLNGPSGAVEFRDGARTPVEVVGDERHFPIASVHLDDGRDPAQGRRVLLRRTLAAHLDRFVGQNAGRQVHAALDGLEDHVFLFPQNKEDSSPGKTMQEGKVHVGAVGQQHVAILQPLAERLRALRIVVRGILHDGERGKAVSDVEAQVSLGGGFLTPVPGPIDAVKRKLQRRGVDGEDVALDPTDEPPVRAGPREVRTDRLKMLEGFPVKLLGDHRVPRAVGVGKRVALRRCRAPDAVELRLMQPGGVADFVQTGRPVQLPIEQSRDMAGARELPDVGARFPGEPVGKPRRNPLDDLFEDAVRCLGWSGYGCFFHTPVSTGSIFPRPAFCSGLQAPPLTSNPGLKSGGCS